MTPAETTSPASIDRVLSPGLEVVTLRGPSYDEHFLTAYPPEPYDPYGVFEAVAAFTRSKRAHIVSQLIFGGADIAGRKVAEIDPLVSDRSWPAAWLRGTGRSGERISGTQVLAVTGPVETIRFDGEVVGCLLEDEYARYCILGDVGPRNPEASRPQQAREAFERTEKALALAGMTFLHVVRTSIYMDRILEWYGEFNLVRDRFFETRGVYHKMVPASTGIGAANARGAALVMGALAIQPKTSGAKIFRVSSPLQCSAMDYCSSFSRAVEVTLPGHGRKLYVSGTASIAPDGKTAHEGDVDKQVQLTMEVIEAILVSREMQWSDTVRAIAYFKELADAPAFHRYCREHGLPKLPVCLAHADVCRDDLLFELELDAVRLGGPCPAPSDYVL